MYQAALGCSGSRSQLQAILVVLRFKSTVLFLPVLLISFVCAAAGPPPKVPMHLESKSTDRPPKSGSPHLSSFLNRLHAQWLEDQAAARELAATQQVAISGDRVGVTILMLDATATSEALDRIREIGGEVTAHFGRSIDVDVPVALLDAFGKLPGVSVVHRKIPPVPLEGRQTTASSIESGTIVTQGVVQSNADDWHAEGFTGVGTSIAIVDSFQDVVSAQAAGELPGVVYCHPNCGSLNTSSRHGTACAEIVYDMAPEATITLSSASSTTEFSQRLVELAAAGNDVISVSLGFPDACPGDGTGGMADAIHTARNTYGSLVAIAAGNHADYHWDGVFADSDVDGYHEFPGGYELNGLDPAFGLSAGAYVSAYLRWEAWPVTDQDFDLHLYYYDSVLGWIKVGGSENAQSGSQPPWEFFQIVAPYTGLYALAIYKWSASSYPTMDLMAWSRNELLVGDVNRSLTEPSTSPDSLSVAAVDVSSLNLESYSSRGPAHGPGGTLSGGWEQPRIAAFANVDTWSYGSGVFNGTSSACPHVAGAAALVRGAYPAYTPANTQVFLESRATDAGSPGWDVEYGEGILWLGDPPCPSPTAPLLSAPSTGSSGSSYSVTWTDTSPDNSYQLQESTDDAFTSPATYNVSGLSRSFSHTVVAPTTYYYRVRAVNECTAGHEYSSWSASDQTIVEPVTPTLTVSLAGTGSGTVTSSPPGIDCGVDCTERCPTGTTMNLSATPDMGSQFSSWGGDDDCTDGSIVMDDDKACTATFDTCSGHSIYDVPAQSVSDAMEFEACNVLRAGTGGFEITGTGNVTFYAGNSIELQNGFAIANGGAFSAVIGAPMGGGGTPLLNGDFESGRTVWTEFSSHGWPLILQSTDLPSGVTPHGGSWAAWLGGDYDETAYIEQNVTIPVSTPYLNFWHWIASEDSCGYDFAAVVVDSTPVDTFDLCSSENTGGWTQHSVDLSSYAGSTVAVQIRVETDSSLNSNLFLDDVSFAASP